MPIISKVQGKSPRGRLIYAAIITFLLVGGLTILYPFVVMVSGSLRSEVDETDLDLVPAYFVDDQVLYRKFLETKYNQDVTALRRAHGGHYFSFRDPQSPVSEQEHALAGLLEQFIAQAEMPKHWQVLGGIYGQRTVPEAQRELRRRLSHRFEGDLAEFAAATGTPASNWNTIVLPVPAWTTRRYEYTDNALFDVYFELLEEAPPGQVKLVSITGLFLESMIYTVYGSRDTSEYNAAHVVPLASFSDFRLPATVPGEDQPTLRAEWIEFVQQELNPSFIVVEGVDDERYRQFLREAYEDDLEGLERAWRIDLGSFEDIVLPRGQWLSGQRRQDYEQFIEEQPAERLRLVGPEYAWRDWLAGQVQSGNPSPAVDPATAALPVAAMEYQYVLANSGSLRWTYAARNYINVFDELVLEGRALINTIVFCLLAIGAALLINPLAAYAMSRFRLPGTYKILLILMATMAFPPMVTLIPQFILLRNLNLLNTFVALVLPLAANGYLIFLLKGFFDSLPSELYEAAVIDGAGEMRMFFQITMALSKPILAVLALMTFNSAYMMFLYPLLVAPSENMWLISVWLFQFQQRASSSGVYASVIIASIPTLIVFLMAQRVIMRGIVVPTEK